MGYVDEAELGATEPDGSVEEEHFEADKKPEVPRHVKYVTQVSQDVMPRCKVIVILFSGFICLEFLKKYGNLQTRFQDISILAVCSMFVI